MFVAPLPEAVLLLSCMHHPAVPGMMTTPEPTTTLGVGCGVKKGAAALVCKLYKNHCHDAKETATPARLGGEGAFVCTRNVETLIKAPFLSGVLRLDVWVVCAPPSWGHVVDGGHTWPPTFFYYYYYCCDHVLVPFWRKAQKILRCNLRHFFFSLMQKCKGTLLHGSDCYVARAKASPSTISQAVSLAQSPHRAATSCGTMVSWQCAKCQQGFVYRRARRPGFFPLLCIQFCLPPSRCFPLFLSFSRPRCK